VLEVIAKGSGSDAHPHPILFVHGAFHAAWCWDEHFLDHFAKCGYRALAVSLRGHGGSPTAKPLRTCTIADYVDDLANTVDALPVSPVLVGHSMGGFVVQKFLEHRSLPAAVLLASAPPKGHLANVLRLGIHHPLRSLRATVTQRPSVVFDTPQRVRQSFFTPRTPQYLVDNTFRRLQEDSPRAAVLDMALLDLVDTSAVSTPILVVGGEQDATHPPKQAHATARAYGTTAYLVRDAGHELMLETSWPTVAGIITDWLGQRQL
jgi:pimeloyl-ACP methyl ester carboxylesterase